MRVLGQRFCSEYTTLGFSPNAAFSPGLPPGMIISSNIVPTVLQHHTPAADDITAAGQHAYRGDAVLPRIAERHIQRVDAVQRPYRRRDGVGHLVAVKRYAAGALAKIPHMAVRLHQPGEEELAGAVYHLIVLGDGQILAHCRYLAFIQQHRPPLDYALGYGVNGGALYRYLHVSSR